MTQLVRFTIDNQDFTFVTEDHFLTVDAAAKYVENLQRSNEQMVKLSALLQKQQGGSVGLSEEDKEDLYDMLNKEEE